ncbi:ShlB/FhaC/HecB family hemolysin secretion/activation protein [Aquabacterium sp.]|uniref:ShlB/FhaC/HecB family hemolysin secretion/activation protein n=1 Tax=Aquabacterium sp. TaxID=1872578 RepID=UPI0019C28F7B|nr:ShlB/FhaC/HecB family hemolysin secretion/activation protein [Aquabacterium sp.]MBC7701226.1 ShlB/FhaC/HecB family hemolysin secretion/activation protein [Aquabacterium sp.]
MRLPSVLSRGLSLVLCVSPMAAWAQAAPGVIPSAQQLQQGRETTLSPLESTAEVPAPAPVPKELGKPSDDITLDVSAYEIDGLNEVPRDVLAKLTAPYAGKARSYEDMVDAAAAVSRYMQRELGYYLGHAYLPEQSPKDGVVRIAVMEGRLDQVLLQWPDKMIVQREVVERYLARLRPGEILRVRDVERVVFMVNDLQGIRARFEVKAGRYAGTASLLVSPQSEPRFGGRAELDTNGSRYSGTNRVGLLATAASPTGRGDGLVANALVSTNGGLAFVLASYVTPVGSDGLKLGASASKVNYQLDKAEFPMDLNGEATAVNAFGLYPFVRSRNLNVFGLLTFEHKAFDDKRFGVSDKKSSDDVLVGVVGDFRDNFFNGGVSTYELNWLQGRMSFDSSVGLPPTDPNFGKLSVGYSRLQSVVSNRLLMYLRFKGQYANTNLDTTERFSLGGPTGVRGFAPGEATADEGQLATAELRFLPYDSWFGRVSREMVFSLFYDWGHAKLRHDASGEGTQFVNTSTLSSAGLGAIWDRPQSFGMRVNVAWPVSGEAKNDQVRRVPRAFATLTKYF